MPCLPKLRGRGRAAAAFSYMITPSRNVVRHAEVRQPISRLPKFLRCWQPGAPSQPIGLEPAALLHPATATSWHLPHSSKKSACCSGSNQQSGLAKTRVQLLFARVMAMIHRAVLPCRCPSFLRISCGTPSRPVIKRTPAFGRMHRHQLQCFSPVSLVVAASSDACEEAEMTSPTRRIGTNTDAPPAAMAPCLRLGVTTGRHRCRILLPKQTGGHHRYSDFDAIGAFFSFWQCCIRPASEHHLHHFRQRQMLGSVRLRSA